MSDTAVDTPCPHCGAMPSLAGQQIGSQRFAVGCVIASPDGVRLKSAAEHTPPRERPVDSWYRQLNDGRIEVMCKAPGFRIRVAAAEEQAWEAVELFEKWTGMTVSSERRPRRRVPVMPGQLPMIELEAESSEN